MARLPVAGSPEAERRGTTWDHRAAGLCMSHVLVFARQTEATLTEETFRREDIRVSSRPGMAEASQSHQIFWTRVGGEHLCVAAICQVKAGNGLLPLTSA